MDALLRLLGLQTMYAALGRLDGRTARWASVAVLVAVNLWPLSQVLVGVWRPGDVLVVFWLENVVVWFWTIVRILTARGAPPEVGATRVKGSRRGPVPTGGPNGCARPGMAAFFSVHYGIFTVVHGVFTAVLAGAVGVTTNRGPYVVAVIVLMLSHGLSTALYWFARGERDVVSPQRAMTQPYGRIVILHVVVLASCFLLVGRSLGGLGGSPAPRAGSGPFGWVSDTSDVLDVRLWPAILLVTIKIVVDVVTHLRQHRPVPERARVA